MLYFSVHLVTCYTNMQMLNYKHTHVPIGSCTQSFVRTKWVQADEPPMCGIIMPGSHHVDILHCLINNDTQLSNILENIPNTFRYYSNPSKWVIVI